MRDLIVVTFDRLEDAREAMRRLRELERHRKIDVEDTAIVERGLDGEAHVRSEVSGTTEKAAVIGGLIGALVTAVIPLVGLVIGAAAGAAVGSLLKTGVDPAFVEEVERMLTPGRSGLFIVLNSGSPEAIVSAMEPFRGQVVQTTLDAETEAQLRETLAHEHEAPLPPS
jgi:uncharacterized membrane protein